MEKLKLTANILFAGIGCQERGFENSQVIDLDVLSIAEIDRNAVLSYAAIHKELSPEMVARYNSYPSETEMIQELTAKNMGYNFKKNLPYNWKNTNGDIIKSTWLANHLANNLGDINRIESLPEADLWTVSFPCQDISIAGFLRGFKKDSGTRSSLLWEQIRLLRKAIEDGTQPKFLLFENVKNIIGSKFKADFLEFLKVLKELGYNAEYRVLNAKDCGIPQNRERVFVICSRKDIDFGGFGFPKPFKCKAELEDIINPKEDREISVNLGRLKKIAAMLNDGNAVEEAAEESGADNRKAAYRVSKYTPKMLFQLMGLKEEDAEKCKKMGVSDNQLCRQAGNGIVTNCVQLIAEHLYKALKDPSFVCTDEKFGTRWIRHICLLNLEKKAV
ncbi:MAG: DNA (cytosine-5-)-methyltransferase [Lachnospiraceae bacterium]|nr:DNA (cytosine-5-)-methyltransferase [Lachnospiraceae bacterium]